MIDASIVPEKSILTPADVAPILGVNPQSIRMQAQRNPSKLGFSVSVIGTRILIPREAFINWLTGKEKEKEK